VAFRALYKCAYLLIYFLLKLFAKYLVILEQIVVSVKVFVVYPALLTGNLQNRTLYFNFCHFYFNFLYLQLCCFCVTNDNWASHTNNVRMTSPIVICYTKAA